MYSILLLGHQPFLLFLNVIFVIGDTLALTVQPGEYMSKLVDYCMVKIYAVIRIKETNQFWSEEDDFSLIKPKLKLECDHLTSGRLGRIRLTFLNPLEVELSRCKVTLECPGAFAPIREEVSNVRAKKFFHHEILVNARQPLSNATVVASFSSREMVDVHGSLKIDIR